MIARIVPTLALAAAFGILATVIASACLAHARWERRRAARAAERAARPLTDLSDGVVAVALAGACCEPWWTSADTDHAPDCRNAQETAR